MCACLAPPVGLKTLEDTHQVPVGGLHRTGCMHSCPSFKIFDFREGLKKLHYFFTLNVTTLGHFPFWLYLDTKCLVHFQV